LATMLVTAHYLTEQGIGTGAESEMAAQGMGAFKRIKSGTIDLERADRAESSDAGTWGATSYGARAWPMLKACIAGPRVTATGSPPCGAAVYARFWPWACSTAALLRWSTPRSRGHISTRRCTAAPAPRPMTAAAISRATPAARMWR